MTKRVVGHSHVCKQNQADEKHDTSTRTNMDFACRKMQYLLDEVDLLRPRRTPCRGDLGDLLPDPTGDLLPDPADLLPDPTLPADIKGPPGDSLSPVEKYYMAVRCTT